MDRSKSLAFGTAVGILAACAVAAAGVPDAPQQWEKCAGISKKGQNDCGSTDGRHSCAGHADKDNDPTEWVYLPAGACDKLVGGKVVGIKPAKAPAAPAAAPASQPKK